MFIPRALRLKGVKEPQKARKARKIRRGSPVQGMEIDDVTATLKQTTFSGPRFTAPKVDEDYLEKLLCGIELLFTDYAHQHEDGKRWLEKHYRAVDGQEKYVHLSAILEHPNISGLKPKATQPLLRQAIESQDSPTLELAANGYLVRRRPSTYPLKFVPVNSFDVVNDDGLGFWDQRTIYVEPHTRDLCKTPARVTQWLKKHGQMKEKWFPIQAVHTLFNSCAFVVLSGNVTHDEVWRKWRELDRPEWWKILTKVEHTQRTEEYLALLREEKPWKHIKGAENMPVKKSQKPLEPTAEETAQTAIVAPSEPGKKKRKRGRNKGGKTTDDIEAADTNQPDAINADGYGMEAEELVHGPSSKKAKF